jgi:hypothetical protein
MLLAKKHLLKPVKVTFPKHLAIEKTAADEINTLWK